MYPRIQLLMEYTRRTRGNVYKRRSRSNFCLFMSTFHFNPRYIPRHYQTSSLWTTSHLSSIRYFYSRLHFSNFFFNTYLYINIYICTYIFYFKQYALKYSEIKQKYIRVKQLHRYYIHLTDSLSLHFTLLTAIIIEESIRGEYKLLYRKMVAFSFIL